MKLRRLTSELLLLAAATIALAACESEPEPPAAPLPYQLEYPGIPYSTAEPAGRLGYIAARVSSGELELPFQQPRGYLESTLGALDIDPASQVMVFSRTSLQVRNILPETPRAIYFNDDSYVAWVPGAGSLELANFDPELGPVFYTLPQDPAVDAVLERELGTCLRCHDTYSMSGGGVPRFLVGSGYTGTRGELVSHEAWILTRQATPLRSRWGGWYVTGRHGDQVHLGNIVVQQAEDLGDLESLRVGNVDDLSGLLDTSIYPTPYSDIVALLVLEHQVEVQNLISRLRYETLGRAAADAANIDQHVEALLGAMLMLDEIELTAAVSGGSGFAEQFESRGPFDGEGRSLRQFDLESRLFRYPLSYLIYSDAFQALPAVARSAVYARLRAVLAATPQQDGFERLSVEDRQAISEILRATLPEVYSP